MNATPSPLSTPQHDAASLGITVGTDCSGIDSIIFALGVLRTPFDHLFSSETDEHCLATIAANHTPTYVYNDIVSRDLSQVPEVDLYAASIPCQAFSPNSPNHTHTLSRRAANELARFSTYPSSPSSPQSPSSDTPSLSSTSSTQESSPISRVARTFPLDGSVLAAVLSYIVTKRPNIFILEFIPGVRTYSNGTIFQHIRQTLEFEDYYHVHYVELNTLFFGIPQNRKRLFIIGMPRALQVNPLHLPFDEPMPIHHPIQAYVDHDHVPKHPEHIPPSKAHLLHRASPGAVFIELGSRAEKFPNAHLYAPTLLSNNRMWCIPENRYLSCREACRLQGFSDNIPLVQVVSDTQFKKQLGNATSLNVLVVVLRAIFHAIGACDVLIKS